MMCAGAFFFFFLFSPNCVFLKFCQFVPSNQQIQQNFSSRNHILPKFSNFFLLSKQQNLLGSKNYGCVVFSFFLLLESLEMARLIGCCLVDLGELLDQWWLPTRYLKFQVGQVSKIPRKIKNSWVQVCKASFKSKSYNCINIYFSSTLLETNSNKIHFII